jgi:hypothetical protein
MDNFTNGRSRALSELAARHPERIWNGASMSKKEAYDQGYMTSHDLSLPKEGYRPKQGSVPDDVLKEWDRGYTEGMKKK